MGSWAGQSGHLGLDTRVPGLAMGTPAIQAIGRWGVGVGKAEVWVWGMGIGSGCGSGVGSFGCSEE